MKTVVFRCTLVLLGSCSVHSAPQQPSRLDLSKYELTFSEDFDHLDVSPKGAGKRWIAHMPSGDQFGDAEFVDPRPGFPFSTNNGLLRIEARKGPDGKWRSGLLASADREGRGFVQALGYFEMRARLPAGDGVWPAFWLLGADRGTYQPEIDIMEFYGHAPGEYEASLHLWDLRKNGKAQTDGLRVAVHPGELSEDFHTYGVKIESDWVHFFFDRREVGTLPITPDYRMPMYILVDLALGAGWPIDRTPNPSLMYVDYIRAWREKP